MPRMPAFTIYRQDADGVTIGKPITIYADGAVLGIEGAFTIVNRMPVLTAEAYNKGIQRGREIEHETRARDAEEKAKNFAEGSQWTADDLNKFKRNAARGPSMCLTEGFLRDFFNIARRK